MSEIPSFPIALGFDPANCGVELKRVVDNPTAWRLWLLWRAGHIVSQHFNGECVFIAKEIDRVKPDSVAGLIECFPHYITGNFQRGNVEEFCVWALPFFSESREVPITITNPRA